MAIVVNEGKLEAEKLAKMCALSEIIITRLYENGDIKIPAKKEQ